MKTSDLIKKGTMLHLDLISKWQPSDKCRNNILKAFANKIFALILLGNIGIDPPRQMAQLVFRWVIL